MRSVTVPFGLRFVVAIAAVVLPQVVSAQSKDAFVRERSSGLIAGQDVMQKNDMDAAMSRSVRSMISIPLVDAKKLIASKDLKGARDKIVLAQLVPDRSGYENHVIARAKLALAAASDDASQIAELYDATAEGTWYTKEEKAQSLQTVAGVFYNAGQYKQAIVWYDRYAESGGNDSVTGLLRGQAYYLAGDFGGAAKVLETEVNRATQTGSQPPEIMLKLLADSSAKTSDVTRFDKAAQLLARYYPTKSN
ncbi:MAG: hypothetical protein CFE43_14680 [Burkholderiales bacterium PBB3]|nr:MAG: hypothetical protein CFE43_14680 [Burkholderiales bacterium PBB3]